jgi:hypothetical protein
MGKSAVLAILAVVFCFTSGCAVLGHKYTDKEMGYSIRPPAGWAAGWVGYVVRLPGHPESVLEKEIPGLKMFVSPHIAGERFRPRLNILVEETSLGVEEYVEKQKSEVPPDLKGSELIGEESVEIGKHWRLVYRLSEANNGERIVCSRDIFVEGGKVYVLTFTASEPQWERMKEAFALCADSFKVKRK